MNNKKDIDSFLLKLFKFLFSTITLGFAVGKKDDWDFIVPTALACLSIVAIIKFLHLGYSLYKKLGANQKDGQVRLTMDFINFLLAIFAPLAFVAGVALDWSTLSAESIAFLAAFLVSAAVMASLARPWFSEQMDGFGFRERFSSIVSEVLVLITVPLLLAVGFHGGSLSYQKDKVEKEDVLSRIIKLEQTR